VERFIDEMCAFGPDLRVTKTEMYEAYEQWCIEEDEEAKGTKTFVGLMNEKGVVKNFEGKKSNGLRIWSGIDLRRSDPDTPVPPQVTLYKSPANKGVVKHQRVTSLKNRKTLLRIPLA
jgi:phage/plasmid-associated DNA primase